MTTQIARSTWNIDAAHSVAEFSIKHMMVSTEKGRFHTLAGAVELDQADPARSSVSATIDVASIDTGEPNRDAHLRSDDFFAAERFPQMAFRSTWVERMSDDTLRVLGDLTIREITKPVTLE